MNRVEKLDRSHIRIDLKVGFSCNNRCRFCVQGEKRSKYGLRSVKELSEILAKNRPQSDSVVFTGGEPCLHPQLFQLIEKARALGYEKIQIQTNGRMFSYKSFCKDIIAAGANEFSPAIHGHVAPLHDYLTRGVSSFEQTLSGIHNLVELNQTVITNTVITRSNFRHLPQLIELLIEIKVNQAQLAFVHPIGSAGVKNNFNNIVPRITLVGPYIHRALEIGSRSKTFVQTEAIPYCFMAGYLEYIGEKIIPPTRVFDAEIEISDYENYRLTQGKAKGPRCNDCSFHKECEGPWKEYPEVFGWDEFVPQT